MPRRILSALLAAALVGGCGAATEPDSTDEPDSTEVASVTISPDSVVLLRRVRPCSLQSP